MCIVTLDNRNVSNFLILDLILLEHLSRFVNKIIEKQYACNIRILNQIQLNLRIFFCWHNFPSLKKQLDMVWKEGNTSSKPM